MPENSAEQSQDWYTQLGGIFIRISSPGEEADMVFFCIKKNTCVEVCASVSGIGISHEEAFYLFPGVQ